MMWNYLVFSSLMPAMANCASARVNHRLGFDLKNAGSLTATALALVSSESGMM